MLIITFLLFIGLGVTKNQSLADISYSNENERDIYLNIMVSNKMQYEMVKSIVGDKHNVEFMFLNEEDSINYEYSEQTVKNLNNMDLFIYSGNDYESWSSKIISKLNSGVGTIDLSRGIRTINYETNDKVNPYYWTGVDEYKVALYNIKSAVQDKDPLNRNLYEENYNKKVKDIENILKRVKESKDDFSKYTFVALDDYLDYFYKSMGITVVKLNNETFKEYVNENKLKPENVVVLKDALTTFNEEGYQVIELQKYDGNKSPEELFIYNINAIDTIIKKTET